MEAIISLIAVVVGYVIIISIVRAGARAAVAGGKAVVKGQSFKEAYTGLADFQVKLIDEEKTFEGASEPTQVKRIQMKGLLPHDYDASLSAFLWIRDITKESGAKPIMSHINTWQEQFTPCFLQEQPMGHMETGVGFTDWVNLGVVIPKTIQPPKGGLRKIEVSIMLIDSEYPPEFMGGSIINLDEIKSKIFTFKTLEFQYEFAGKGYEEASKDADKAREITIKIAMAVAMSDGSLDKDEGNAIKSWVAKSISHLSDERQKTLKKLYNDAIKESYSLAKKGELSLSNATKQLNKLDEEGQKYEAMSLCYEVLAADGVATKNELKTIEIIGEALNLNATELSNMRDKALIDIATEGVDEASDEEILGIKSSWSDAQIKKHLIDNFKKWNSRIHSLQEGKERENAQKMLDRIAVLRQKYGD